MGRPSKPPQNALGVAMRVKRADVVGDEIAALLMITRGTYYNLERGIHQPSYDTAKKLATWLGWTTDQVMEAAKAPAPPESP